MKIQGDTDAGWEKDGKLKHRRRASEWRMGIE
jgi:hypothetical protein